MARIAIVTDSGCDLSPTAHQRAGVTIVPHHVTIGEHTALDRVTISPAQFYRRMPHSPQASLVTGPSVTDFLTVYRSLGRQYSEIISIHTSSRLSSAFEAAVAATSMLSNQLRVVVIDSQSVSLGLGFIVKAAAEAAARGDSLDEIVASARGMLLQTHLLFSVEAVAYMEGSPLGSQLRSANEEAPDSRPLLQLEEGCFEVAERVRTRAKAVERLYEFVELFPHLEDLGVLYSTTASDADSLVKRIDAVYPREQTVVTVYGPLLGSILGPGALGIAAYEGKD